MRFRKGNKIVRWHLFNIGVGVLAFVIGSLSAWQLLPNVQTNVSWNLVGSDEDTIKNAPRIDFDYFARQNYDQPIRGKGSPPTFVCHDKQIKPVWSLILRNREARQYLDYRDNSGRKIDCAEEFRKPTYLKVDINGSGLPKIVIQGEWSKDFCGMYSGCWLGIFEVRGNNYKPLFINGNAVRVGIKNTSTNGYRDLIVHSSGGVYCLYSDDYRFDGRRYRVRKCYITSFDYYDKAGRQQHSQKPVTTNLGCQGRSH